MTNVAILRCAKLPEFINWETHNLDELFEEDNLLIRGFEEQGFEASSVVWNSPGIDWNKFDIAIIRSTWDYLDERESFLNVLSQINASSCRLYNSLEAVRWNIDKHYLFDLERLGAPVIPAYLASNYKPEELYNIFAGKNWQTVILKPTIGLGASYTYQIPLNELVTTLEMLRTSRPGSEYLIQPFIESVVTEGEWSFIYFNKKLSHVLLKKPAPGDYRVQGIYGGSIETAEPEQDDLLQAEAVINMLPFDILFARLDFVRVDGKLSVIEAEMIEPVLSFNLVPESIARLVNAVKIRTGTER